MLISSLQQFIRLLVPPLAACGLNATAQKSVTGSLEALVDALEPFKQMDAEKLAELLKIAQELQESGKLPDWVMARQPKTAKPRTPSAPKVPKMTPEQAVSRLREFQERSSGLDPDAIDREMQVISVLTVAQLKEVHKQFLGAVVGSSKPQHLAALRKQLDDFQTSRDRAEGMSLR